MVFSRAHTSATAQHSPLIQSTPIRNQHDSRVNVTVFFLAFNVILVLVLVLR